MSRQTRPVPAPHLLLWSVLVMAPIAIGLWYLSGPAAASLMTHPWHSNWTLIPGVLGDLRVARAPALFSGVLGSLAGMALLAGLRNLVAAFVARRRGLVVRADDFAGPARLAVLIGALAVLLAAIVAAGMYPAHELPGLDSEWWFTIAIGRLQHGVTVTARLGTLICLVSWIGAGAIRLALLWIGRERKA